MDHAKGFVTLKELASEFGVTRSNLRKWVIKYGFQMFAIRTRDSGSQATLAFTPEEAEKVRELRQSKGFNAIDGALGSTVDRDSTGWFYAVQLIPELCPGRIKFGYAGDCETRLTAHRCAAPTAVLVKAWPCKRSWESTAIDCLSVVATKSLSNEVFEFESLDLMLSRADQFFGLLPPAHITP